VSRLFLLVYSDVVDFAGSRQGVFIYALCTEVYRDEVENIIL
jgi:hypothetical protein